MRRTIGFGLVAATLVLALPAGAQVGGESIRTFTSEVAIEPDGDLLVTETIAYDFGISARHGIVRDIPIRVRYDGIDDRVYPLDVVSVRGLSQETPSEYELSTEGNDRRIKIGDPDRLITGFHTYEITYRVGGALNAFDDHDELVWNVVGTEWDVSIGRVEARVTVPGGATDVLCTAGSYGSNLPCDGAAIVGGVGAFEQGVLGPRQAMTVSVAFPKGAADVGPPILEERWSLARAFSLTPATVGTAAGLLVVIVVGIALLVWRVGRDRQFTGGPVEAAFGTADGAHERVPVVGGIEIPVEFVPPDGLRPGQLGTLIDERANTVDVTATIVDLAVRGYLRIEETDRGGWFRKPDWRLVRLRTDADELKEYEARLVEGLFGPKTEIDVSTLRTTFATEMRDVQDLLYKDAIDQGWFRMRPDRVTSLWRGIGFVALAVAVTALVVAVSRTSWALVTVPLAIGALVLILAAKWMPRRTAKGTAVLRRARGFKRFIDESEKERARFAERHDLFTEYLPYAIVFGATEKWAAAFAALGQAAPETSGWYVGTPGMSFVGLGHSLDGFSVTTAGFLSSSPASTGGASAFGGGFSGGGFAGGGGGGGGGGSW